MQLFIGFFVCLVGILNQKDWVIFDGTANRIHGCERNAIGCGFTSSIAQSEVTCNQHTDCEELKDDCLKF